MSIEDKEKKENEIPLTIESMLKNGLAKTGIENTILYGDILDTYKKLPNSITIIGKSLFGLSDVLFIQKDKRIMHFNTIKISKYINGEKKALDLNTKINLTIGPTILNTEVVLSCDGDSYDFNVNFPNNYFYSYYRFVLEIISDEPCELYNYEIFYSDFNSDFNLDSFSKYKIYYNQEKKYLSSRDDYHDVISFMSCDNGQFKRGKILPYDYFVKNYTLEKLVYDGDYYLINYNNYKFPMGYKDSLEELAMIESFRSKLSSDLNIVTDKEFSISSYSIYKEKMIYFIKNDDNDDKDVIVRYNISRVCDIIKSIELINVDENIDYEMSFNSGSFNSGPWVKKLVFSPPYYELIRHQWDNTFLDIKVEKKYMNKFLEIELLIDNIFLGSQQLRKYVARLDIDKKNNN